MSVRSRNIETEFNNIEIIDISDVGRGIGRSSNGLIVFVENAVPGDIVNARITKKKKNYLNAVVSDIVSPSPFRITPECPYAEVCGGCALSHISYDMQLKIKEKHVRDKLERIGRVTDPAIRPAVPSPSEFRYRNKAEFTIAGEKVGFNAAHTHDVFDCADCLLQHPAAAACADAVRKYTGKYGDDLRRLLVRTSSDGEVMVMVTSPAGISHPDYLYKALGNAAGSAGCGLASFYQRVQPRRGHAAQELIGGMASICEKIGGVTFEISPSSFFQVNTEGAKLLYEKVKEYAALTGDENVLDLYCGVGSIGQYCAGSAGYVLGIESSRSAVKDARRNAALNGIPNVKYIPGKAEIILPEAVGIADKTRKYEDIALLTAKNADVVILDPPRAGCGEKLLRAAAMPEPEKIVYVSCDAGTLARDVKILGSLGYRLAEATPVDMFAQTGHVETVCLLSRQK